MLGASSLSTEQNVAESIPRRKWDILLDVLNFQKRESTENESSEHAALQIANVRIESLKGMRKEEILSLLNSLGHRQPVSLRKQKLVTKLFEI